MLVGSQLIDSGLKNPFYTLLIKLLSNKSQYEERMDKFLAEINKIKIDPLQIISNKQKFDIEGKNTLTPSIRNIKNSEYKDFNDYELKEFEEKALNEQLLIKNNQDFIDYYLIHKATMKNYLSENELVVEFHGKVIRLYDYNEFSILIADTNGLTELANFKRFTNLIQFSKEQNKDQK